MLETHDLGPSSAALITLRLSNHLIGIFGQGSWRERGELTASPHVRGVLGEEPSYHWLKAWLVLEMLVRKAGKSNPCTLSMTEDFDDGCKESR
jgi:hypothetical protein